jgi:hypothetical protein
MNYRNILPLVSHTQAFSTDYWNDFGYWNDGTFWYEKTPTYTARVTAYATATGITDYTILDPLNIFDLGLTYYGLDTIMKAVYPMVTDKTSQSDMANQMKYNFMNPLDTNPAFRLNWVGGWVYSRTGALPNGTTGYADTSLIPSTSGIGLNSSHLSFYSRTSTIINGERDMGAYVGGNNPVMGLGTNTGVYLSDSYSFTTNRLSSSIANASAFFIGNRTNSTTHKLYRNGNQLGTTDTVLNTNTLPNINVYLGAVNQIPNVIPVTGFSTKECAFASIGNGLTDFQADIFSTLVNNLQKALNRAVY